MKVKKSWFVLTFISLILSLCILGFGTSAMVSYAETSESEIQTNQSEAEDPAGDAADETNNAIKEWITVILGGIDTIFSAGLLGVLTLKKKQSVAVTVNDAQTQQKLESLHAENTKLQEVLVAMLTLEKGTLDVLKALYAENPNLDDKVKNIINSVSLNSESIIKDIKEIFNKDNSEKVKQVFNAVSNIVLG